MALAMLLGACSASWSAAPPAVPSFGAHARPVPSTEDYANARPPKASPGESVELRYPPELLRTIAFSLERRHARQWQPTHCLVEAGYFGDGQDAPAEAWPYNGCASERPGVRGPAVVNLPTDVPAGAYRICAVGVEGLGGCAQVEVT